MTFSESISTVFSKYATTKGRATRSEYWWFYLFNVLVSLGATLMDYVMGGSVFASVFAFVWSLAVLVPSICVGIRRLHDINRSGWWIIVPIVSVVMLLIPSDPNPNEYDIVEE
jgi:uncharacterized membrane protein YhaH (DUF805 family)